MLVFCAAMRLGISVPAGAANKERTPFAVLIDACQIGVEIGALKRIGIPRLAGDQKKLIGKAHPMDRITHLGRGIRVGLCIRKPLTIANTSQHVGFHIIHKLPEPLGSREKMRIPRKTVQLANAVKAGHQLIGLSLPPLVLTVPKMHGDPRE